MKRSEWESARLTSLAEERRRVHEEQLAEKTARDQRLHANHDKVKSEMKAAHEKLKMKRSVKPVKKGRGNAKKEVRL